MKKNTKARAVRKAAAPAAKKPEAAARHGDKERGNAVCQVYCGPSVRNVAKQFTVYNGALPEALAEFLAKHPAARSLVVPVEQFAQTRKDLQIAGTPKDLIFQSVVREITGKQ